MKINFNSRSFSLEVRRLGFWGKFRGLMFRSSKSANLFFEFGPTISPAIHSYFVFFPFLALWLNNKNKVVEWNWVQPFTFYLAPKNKVSRLVEIPVNKKNKRILDFFVDKKETFKYFNK